MLRIGKMADYALLITNQMVIADQLSTTEALASATQLPLATVRKLLKQLVDANIVKSQRGAYGGYTLAKDPKHLSIADVISAIEGPIALTQCASDLGTCNLFDRCALKNNWSLLNDIVGEVLQKISLTDMSCKINARKQLRPSLSVIR